MTTTTTTAAVVGVCCVGLALVGWFTVGVVGGRIAVRSRRGRVLVVDVAPGEVVLEATRRTVAPGAYRIHHGPDDALELAVGDVLHRDDGTVTRVLAGSVDPVHPDGQPLRAGDSVVWTSHPHRGPEDLGLPYQDVTVTGPGGTWPAWQFPGRSDTWAVHVHGIHSSRAAALQTVPAAIAAGLSSLVVSYRGDLEDRSTDVATFGQSESADVAAAIDHALAQGARSIVLVGWSMGGTISTILAHRPEYRRSVSALVLVGPVLDWRESVRTGVALAGLPVVFTASLVTALCTPGLSRLVGLPSPLRRHHLRPSVPAVPTLVLHSTADRDASYGASARAAAADPVNITMASVPAVPHGLERSADPATFDAHVTQFLARVVAGTPAVDGDPGGSADARPDGGSEHRGQVRSSHHPTHGTPVTRSDQT